ncbi:MAG: hypothetical protein LBH47_03215 [Christensenellaceae bacterium]|nr:hypothetical protein [Christensenellaceae bacterium]
MNGSIYIVSLSKSFVILLSFVSKKYLTYNQGRIIIFIKNLIEPKTASIKVNLAEVSCIAVDEVLLIP